MSDVPQEAGASAPQRPDGYNIGREFEKLNASMRGGFSFLRPDLNDTTLVMMATSLIDQYMKFVLVVGFGPGNRSKRLIDTVFEGAGPLATFSSKISLCAALGFITGDTRHDLTILRKVRNEFAHSPSERRLQEFPQCKSLRLVSQAPIKDTLEERRKFKHSCAGILPNLAVAISVKMAQQRLLADNRETLEREAHAFIRDVYSRPEEWSE